MEKRTWHVIGSPAAACDCCLYEGRRLAQLCRLIQTLVQILPRMRVRLLKSRGKTPGKAKTKRKHWR